MIPYNPFAEAVIAEPFAFYEALRRGPRAFPVEGTDIYALSRYEDVVHAARHHEIFSSTGGVGPEWDPHPMMSMYDPPEHTRLRRIVARAFTPRTVSELAVSMRSETHAVLDAFSAQGGGDFVTEFAEPLVAGMIANLIGLPPEFRSAFRRWSVGITSVLGKNVPSDEKAQAEDNRRELVRALRTLVATRTATPGPGLVNALVDATHDERLSEPELIAFCVLLLVAGFETTVNALANTAVTLMAVPERFERVCETRELVSTAVDEALRLAPPVHAFFRNTLSEARFPDGSVIPEKKKVMLLFASANRDAAKFADPDTFIANRKESADHLSFGSGVHTCLGAPLAKQLLRIVVDACVERVERLELRSGVVFTNNTLLRGYQALPLDIKLRSAGSL